jgi:DNA-binding response OmpR family regulator
VSGIYSRHVTLASAVPVNGQRALVVDDDATVADVLSRYLAREGFTVQVVVDGPSALETASRVPPDVVVLDLGLPGLDGLEVCRRLREVGPVPVVMLTARGSEADRIVGLEVGADDYVTKPFSPRELVLRIQAVLRRAASPPGGSIGGVVSDGDLVVDTTAHEVFLAGSRVTVTSREYDLLLFLLRHQREVFDRTALLEKVWGWTYADTATVTVHVRRLREKIELDPAMPVRIVTVWGVGYRYEPGQP